MLSEDVHQKRLVAQHFARDNVNVGGRAVEAGAALVDHDSCIGKSKSLALSARGQKNGAHAHRVTHA